MRIASFGVLIGLLLAQLAVYCVGLSVSVGDSRTLPCHGDPSSDVEWWFKQDGHIDWLLVAELHNGSFSPGSSFQGRVESFYLTEPGNYSLTLSPVVYSDLGIYECRYKNKTILSDRKLHIFVPSRVPIVMGMSASLPCFGNIKKNTSADNLDILWKRDEKIVYQLLKNSTTYGPGFENRTSLVREQALHGNLTLTIRQTRFSDEGNYQCFYNSPKENGNPDSVRLTVTGLPRSVADSGLSAGAVAGIVLLLVLLAVCFLVWKYRARFSRPPVSVPETQPSHPEPCLPLSEIQASPAEPRLSEPETEPSHPEPHLSEPETQPLMPETQPLMPETQPLMPETQSLMPETQHLMPETQPLMPETQPLMPETQPQMSETQPFDQNEKLEKGDGIL